MSKATHKTVAQEFAAEFGDDAAEFDRVAATTSDPAEADACAILAALARGEDPPEAAARRVVRRAREGAR